MPATVHCLQFYTYKYLIQNYDNSTILRIFIFCWPCISSQIVVNNLIYSFHLSTCFEHQVLIIRRSNCINTSSGTISLCKWLLDISVLAGISSSHLHRLIIPDDVLIQFDLLMMSTVMLETCREMKWINKYMKKCIRLVINKNPQSFFLMVLFSHERWYAGQPYSVTHVAEWIF